MAKIDLSDLKGIKLDEMLGDLRDEAGKRAASLIGDGRGQVKSARRAIADPNDGDMFGAFVLGIAVGALVGAAVALLLTPVSGSEARKKLTEQAEKLRDERLRKDPGSEWDAHAGTENGKTAYQTTPTHGAADPVR